MSCNSIVALPKLCKTGGSMAGIEKLWVISYDDLVTGTSSTATYTLSGNIVSSISIGSGKTFSSVGVVKATTSLEEKLTKNVANGTAFMTQTLAFQYPDVDETVKGWLEAIMFTPVAIIYKSRNGNYFFAGGNGMMELSDVNGGSGKAEGDLSGYTITFTGMDTKLISKVNPTYAISILS